jgi:N-acetylglucosaminyldiphosphoundecaprenol N-acetyl-beta-D-mannosaminyltransferase
METDNVNILGVRVNALRLQVLHQKMHNIIRSKQHSLVLNVNVNCLNLAYKNPWMQHLINRADIVFCDGIGVVFGARILGFDIPERITYADWIWQLAEFAEPLGFTFYFLGGRPGLAEKAAACLKDRFPNLQILGAHHGFFDKTPASPENESIIQEINALKPNILIVAFGMPLQERWLMENWDRVSANIALTGGAVFDYASGTLQRAPRWMIDNGLEWMGRLFIEPHRLWKRYLLGNPIFLWRVVKQRFGLIEF